MATRCHSPIVPSWHVPTSMQDSWKYTQRKFPAYVATRTVVQAANATVNHQCGCAVNELLPSAALVRRGMDNHAKRYRPNAATVRAGCQQDRYDARNGSIMQAWRNTDAVLPKVPAGSASTIGRQRLPLVRVYQLIATNNSMWGNTSMSAEQLSFQHTPSDTRCYNHHTPAPQDHQYEAFDGRHGKERTPRVPIAAPRQARVPFQRCTHVGGGLTVQTHR